MSSSHNASIAFQARTALAVLLLALGGCTSVLSSMSDMDSGKKAAEPVIAAVQAYFRSQGTYPPGLDVLALSADTRANAQLYGLRYMSIGDGKRYSVSFSPTGPVHLCSFGESFPSGPTSGNARWSCLMK